MKKTLVVGLLLLSASLFANDCGVNKKITLESFKGKVVNVGPDHSMDVVMKITGKTYYLQFEDKETKKFFQKNNYKIFEVFGTFGDPDRWPPSFIVEDYKLLD